MERRELGTTGRNVTEVGLGTWNIGGSWGDVGDEEGRDVVRSALDAGIDFVDIIRTLRVLISRQT